MISYNIIIILIYTLDSIKPELYLNTPMFNLYSTHIVCIIHIICIEVIIHDLLFRGHKFAFDIRTHYIDVGIHYTCIYEIPISSNPSTMYI